MVPARVHGTISCLLKYWYGIAFRKSLHYIEEGPETTIAMLEGRPESAFLLGQVQLFIIAILSHNLGRKTVLEYDLSFKKYPLVLQVTLRQ